MAIIAYSAGVTNPAPGTNLGIPITGNGVDIAQVPNTLAIATVNFTATGSGYTAPDRLMSSNLDTKGVNESGQVLCSTTSDGKGTGATFLIDTEYSLGALVLNQFMSRIPSDQTRVASGVANRATAGIIGTGANGAGATYVLSADASGNITSVRVLVAGTGYIVGETIVISKAAIDADGGIGIATGNVTIIPRLGDVSDGMKSSNIRIQQTGAGYAIGEVLTLQEIGSSDVGTATVTILTLNPGATQDSTQLRYPVGLLVGQPGLDGSTAVLTGKVNLTQMDGSQVVINGLTTGKILPIMFSAIVAGANTTIDLPTTTIFYK